MEKVKKILKEKSTWAIGVPSLVVGVGTLLDGDHVNEVASAITVAGNQYVATGDWSNAIGWFVAGLVGIFLKGRK